MLSSLHRQNSSRSCLIALVLGVSLLAACHHAPTAQAPSAKYAVQDSAALHQVIEVRPWLISGAQPEGEAAFAELHRRGVKTILSVDGLAPNAQLAKRHGMTVVHLPIGYDGVPAEAQAGLAKLAREDSGPIYVHCHHGKHRGPAAAAIMIRARDGATVADTKAFMQCAGTSANYDGLWRDVAAFDPALPGEWEGPLPEAAAVGDFAAQMAELDRIWDRVKLCRESGWEVPADHPDVSPPHEALMLHEAFREMQRLPAPHSAADFAAWMEASVTQTAELNTALRESTRSTDRIEAAFSVVATSCKQCHHAYRD